MDKAISNRGHMIFALMLMAQFQLWDTIITQVMVKSGLASEANPLMAPLLSIGSFTPVKLLGLAALVAALWVIFRHLPRAAITAASATAVFYLGVITWNFLVFFSSVA